MLEVKENDYDLKEEEESKDLLKLPINLGKENFLLKIFPSKDNISLIFKLEKVKVQTYYYYAKFEFNDFKNINKKFSNDANIMNVFLRLKDITQNCVCSLEKKIKKINISFIKKNTEFHAIFTVRKKIVGQTRLNLRLVNQIQENKLKLKLLKRQIAKLDKTIHNKNDLIDNINMKLDKMTNDVNNINIKENNIENNESDNIKSNNKSNYKNNNKNNSKDCLLKESENEDEIKKTYKINEQENLLLKQNLSLIKDYHQSGKEQEGKRYISNNRKKKNKNKLKKIKAMIKIDETPKDESQDDTLFCFENIDVYKNKKIYETFIIFNVITVLIVMYLLCTFYALKSNLKLEKIKDREFMKKLAFLSLLESANGEDMEGMRENIVDFHLKNNDDSNTNTNPEVEYSVSRKKMLDLKETSLLKEERDKKYYKKHIRKKLHFRVKDITFELKYNSKDAYKYKNIYNNYKDINDVLLILKTKDNKKISFFSNNIFINNNNLYTNNFNYVGFVYNKEQIREIEIMEFYEIYGKYLHKLYEFLRREYLRIKNKYNYSSYELIEDIELFEIYEVKFIR